ncbi:MAG: shikimate kinase [Bacteroidaceae bacterium]|nr:shikimate kinase [Bacteroidaceae bacterium]
MKRIILTGYMGVGKTTVGRSLAATLGLGFYDLDWYISSRRRKSISDLFAEFGEDGFRNIEHNMLHEVCEFENVVVSCGGGTPCFFDNMEYMNRQGETIYIKASPEYIIEHLTESRNVRPLLANMDKEQLQTFVIQQIAEREKYYLQSKHILSVDGNDLDAKIKDFVTFFTSESSY